MTRFSEKAPRWTGWEGWALQRKLGEGGNGDVWEATHLNGDRCAIKFLRKIEPERYTRFQAEVEALSRLGGHPGILPILQSELPSTPSKDAPPWYAMPLAEPAMPKLENSTLSAITAMVSIARCVTSLHERTIVHRDIKPDNILFWNDTWCLADFGLVDFDGRPPLTRENEMVGPKWTIAPEMRRFAKDADGRAADVYSMAKTLWMFITGDMRSFDGRYDRRSNRMSLSPYLRKDYLRPLHALMEEATQYDPERRPSAASFADRLEEWLKARGDFVRQCSAEWSHIQSWLFPNARPARVEWRDVEAIATVLQELSETQNVNHCFFASSGGLDLDSCSVQSDGTLLIDFNGIDHIVRPSMLEAYLWYDHPEWSYFWLELMPMEPLFSDEDEDCVEDSRLPKDNMLKEEHVLKLPSGRLLPAKALQQGYIATENGDEAPIPRGSRRVVRLWNGPIAIFSKASPYNQDPTTYDARHAKMGREAFFAYIARFVEAWRRRYSDNR